MSSYQKAVGGRLKIGGAMVEAKKKKKKRKRSEGAKDAGVANSGDEGTRDQAGEEEEEPELEVRAGSGRIISSGIVVTGYDTKFMDELKVQDAIIVTHPTTLQEETRIVKMVVSNTGMTISSAFSSDLISTTGFRYIHPPENEAEKEDPEEQARKKRMGEEQQAFGTYSSSGGTKLVYRVKKGGAYGGYKIVSEDANDQLSRTELLELRTKHKSDRHAL